MIAVLHRGGYAQMITILHRGRGVSQDPKKLLRNMCTTPYGAKTAVFGPNILFFWEGTKPLVPRDQTPHGPWAPRLHLFLGGAWHQMGPKGNVWPKMPTLGKIWPFCRGW